MTAPRLFHVSEERGLRRFEPRPSPAPSPGLDEDVVWAIDEPRLPNYLLPRDCPRVCFAPAPDTTHDDAKLFFGGRAPHRVIAVEQTWRVSIEACRLSLYEMPPQAFRLHDISAGYWISSVPVTATTEAEVADLPGEIARRGAELMFMPSLWLLFDAVKRSSLAFSAIRMRNAQPRTETE